MKRNGNAESRKERDRGAKGTAGVESGDGYAPPRIFFHFSSGALYGAFWALV